MTEQEALTDMLNRGAEIRIRKNDQGYYEVTAVYFDQVVTATIADVTHSIFGVPSTRYDG